MKNSAPNPIIAFLLILFGGIALAAITLTAIATAAQVNFQSKVLTGVSVAGIDVSGLSVDDAAIKISDGIVYPGTGRIAFQDRGSVWIATPAQVGINLDARASAQAAYQVGRGGNPVQRVIDQIDIWQSGVDVAPVMIFDESLAQAYIASLAEIVDRPTIEATLGINGVEVLVHSGQVGRIVNIAGTSAQIPAQIPGMTDMVLPLVIDETAPVILDATEQAGIAENILSAPLVLVIAAEDGGSDQQWVLNPESLAGMLAVERVETDDGSEKYQVGLSTTQLSVFLDNIGKDLVREPANARFVFNDETGKLEPIESSVRGRTLLVPDTVDLIQTRLTEGKHRARLVFEYTEPGAADSAKAKDLGITELVNEQISYFYGSSSERIQNISVAAERFHGLVIAPGETFSMASVMGDISLDEGYAEAWIIFGDRTIKGVGGGVCQVSTTLFRTVFFGGYQIDERYSHAYRVSYYEQTASGAINTSLAGLDATVYVPLVDFKFTNDSDHWLLMETYVNQSARSLTWKFYSTDDGREVDWSTTGLTNTVKAPEPLYEENNGLKKGEIRQVDWEVKGADVTVTRTVVRNGEIINEDVFVTHYQPWRSVYQYGPGTKLPEDG